MYISSSYPPEVIVAPYLLMSVLHPNQHSNQSVWLILNPILHILWFLKLFKKWNLTEQHRNNKYEITEGFAKTIEKSGGKCQWLLRKNLWKTFCAETISADVSHIASFLWGISVSLEKHLSGRVSSKCVILIITWITFSSKMIFWFTHWVKYLKANQTFFQHF